MARVTMEKIINIKTVAHKTTGLLVATSPDMPGLYVHARSQADMAERIPQAIKAILEADGYTVTAVEPIDGEPDGPDFVATPTRFHAIAA
jgi:hypothetical protein